MKKTILIIASLVVSIFVGQAQNLTLEEILEKHFEAIGQEKVNKVKSITMTGKILMQGMELPLKTITKRPDKARTEMTMPDYTIVSAYNGKDGWTINPMVFGTIDPQDMGEEEVKQYKEGLKMDGVLYNWKEKAYTLELIAKEDIEGKEAYKIKLTKKQDKKGDVSFWFIDSGSFVILKFLFKIISQGVEMETETSLSNYKIINGMALPFAMEIKVGGNTVMQQIFEEIKFDEEIDDKIFDRPDKKE